VPPVFYLLFFHIDQKSVIYNLALKLRKLMDIRASIDYRKPGPSFILLYLLGVGFLDTALRIGIGSEGFSLLSLYSHTLLFSLFFMIILIIFRCAAPREKIHSLIKNISMLFWIVGLTPISSYYIYGEVPTNILYSELGSILLIFFFAIVLLNFSILSKIGIFKSIFSSLGILALSIPIFSINRVLLIDVSRPHFKLYELFTVDVFLQQGWSIELFLAHRYHLLIVLLLLENFLIYTLFAYKYLSERFMKLLKTIKPFRTLHFVMMVLLGVIFVQHIMPDEALSIVSINHFPFIFLPALCLVLLWQFTTLLNDIYDQDIDIHVHPERPLVSDEFDRPFYIDILIFFALLSSLLSILLGPFLLFLNLAALILAVLYSVPPMRLRDKVYGHVCVGLGSLIGFLFGVYSPVAWKHGIYLSSRTVERNIPLLPDVLLVGMLIIIVLSISPLINALSDYEGDKKSGVRNVYTVLGLEKGKKLVSILIVFLFISPTILFNSTLDIAFMLLTGIISSIIFYRKEDHRPVFGLYFLVLIYLILRFITYL